MNKVCSTCKQEKSLENFCKNKRFKDGHERRCKSCKNDSTKKYYSTDRKGRETHRSSESIRRSRNKKTTLLTNAKQRAKKHNIDFNIVADDIVFPEYCPVLGIKLEYNLNKLSDNSPTIDRIDNMKGYIKGNIKVISWRANRIKCDASIDEIEKILSYMYGENILYRNSLGVKTGDRKSKHYTFNNESRSLLDWSIILGINYSTLNNRINRMEWSVEKSFTTPVEEKNK